MSLCPPHATQKYYLMIKIIYEEAMGGGVMWENGEGGLLLSRGLGQAVAGTVAQPAEGIFAR